MKHLEKNIAGFLIIVLTVPLFLLPNPKPANALLGIEDIVFDPQNFVQTTATAAFTGISSAADSISATFMTADNFKEYVLDPLAWYFAKALLDTMTASIIDWINSGFQGNPAFVNDLKGFMIDVADQAAGGYIYGGDLAFLCSPFALQIRIALARTRAKQRIQCRLSTVVKNIDTFFDRGVQLQTLEQWTFVTLDQGSNPYSAYITAKNELDARIAGATGRAAEKLRFSSGFRDVIHLKSCLTPQSEYEGIKLSDEDRGCITGTPGTVIDHQLGDTLTIGNRQLLIADEFDEIINALVGQLAKQALTGIGGLSGLSDSSRGTSYTQRILQEENPAAIAVRRTLVDTITRALQDEQRYRSLPEREFFAFANAASSLGLVVDCYNQKIGSGALSPSDLATAQTAVLQATTTVQTVILPRRLEAENRVASSTQNILLLQNLIQTASRSTAPDALQRVANEYQSLVGSHSIHNQIDILSAERTESATRDEMNAIASDAVQRLSVCQLFPQPSP